jgi:hypothetical protein
MWTVVVAVLLVFTCCHGYTMIPTAGKLLSSSHKIQVGRAIATTTIAFMSSVPETMTMTRLAVYDDDSNQVIQEQNNNSSNSSNSNEDGNEKSGKKRAKLGRFWRRIKRLMVSRESRDNAAVDDADVDDPPPTSNSNLQDAAAAVENVILSEENNKDASSQEDKPETETETIPAVLLPSQPEGIRWAISSNSTNLSGLWKPIITPEFKQQYDEYLRNCSQPLWFRNLVSNVLGTTREQVQQYDNGRELVLTSKNPAGEWKRTLVASGSDLANGGVFEPVYSALQDPDKDSVKVESWWEQQGTVHKSILRGKPRVKGGEFETIRYLEANENGSARDDIFVCESYFHPSSSSSGQQFRSGYVKWRFSRVL